MRYSVSLLSLVAMGALTGQAAAILPPETGGPAPGVLELKAGDPVRTHADIAWVAPTVRASAWSRFLKVAGGQWEGLWDVQTNVPMTISGSGIPAPGTIANDAEAERFARAFLAEHIALLAPGANPSDLRLGDNITDGENRTVTFVQTHQGMDVLDGGIVLEFKNDRLFVMQSTAFPNVQVPASLGTASLDTMRASASAWMADVGRTLVAGDSSPAVVLPMVRRSGTIEYRRVVPVEVKEPNGFGTWTVYVDSANGSVVARKDNLLYADGTLKYRVPERSPLYGMRREVGAAAANVSISGTTSKTDNWGAVTWTGTAAATVTTNCTGTYASVNNNNASGAKITGMVTVQPGAVGVWDLGMTERSDSQLTTFISTNVVKENVARYAPRGQIAWLNNMLTANVNQPQFCNANWNGSTMQFFSLGTSGSNQCENTGRITDVIYHEFGHGLHQNIIMSGVSRNGAMGEGVGDVTAFTITNDFVTARGFFTNRPMEGIRDHDTTDKTWPPPAGEEIHLTGIIYGGWMWDLRKNLRAMFGDKEGTWQHDRLFYESVRRASTIPASYTQVVAMNDDDGNTMNGTPFLCAINEAGARHGLAQRTVAGQNPFPAPPEVAGNKVTVKLLGYSLCSPQVDPMTANLSYLAPGSTTPTTINLTKDAMNNYVGDLPAQADNTVGQFKATITFPNGKSYNYPDNPADPNYQVYTGTVQNLYCNKFDDAMAPADWTHTGMPATADEWEWGPPGEVANTNDPRSAKSGANVYGMDLGKWTTDGVYATGTSSLTSPMVNTAGMRSVRLQYWRQLNVETGANDQASIYANGTKVWSNATTGNHVDKEWRFHDVDITTQAASGNVQIKYELIANATNNFGGWNIDDFCIVGIAGDAGVPPLPDAGTDGSTDGSGGAAGSDGSAGAAGSGIDAAGGMGGMGGGAPEGGAGKGGAGAGGRGGGGAGGADGGGAGGMGGGGTGVDAGSMAGMGGGGAGGRGGSTGTGATGGSGGGSNIVPPDDSGCSCKVESSTSAPPAGPLAWMAALPLVGLLLRRRRR